MFFIARIVPAMLMGSSGSYRTTRARESLLVGEFRGSEDTVWAKKNAGSPRDVHREPAQITSSDYRPSSDEAIDDDDDGDHKQNVNESTADVHDEESQDPQD
jgi:hypothetical protein